MGMRMGGRELGIGFYLMICTFFPFQLHLHLHLHILTPSPTNSDRTTPLESRPDSLGRLIRLLSSVYHPRLASSAGELIFVVCDNDSGIMSAQIGYGNAAGYLFNKGILSAPPASSSSKGKERAHIEEIDDDDDEGIDGAEGQEGDAEGDKPTINPITGTFFQKRDRGILDEMTEEEKEREAEKLFVLFDRLEKSGVASNPIRQAMQEGKMEKYRGEVERKERGSDDDE